MSPLSEQVERVCLAQDVKPKIEAVRKQIKAGRWPAYHRGGRIGAVLTGRQHPLRLEQIDTSSPWWRLWGDVQWETAE